MLSATRKTLRTPAALADAGLIPTATVPSLEQVARQFAVAVTPEIAELIAQDAPDDPIARQYLPDPAELQILPSELSDPIGDDTHSPIPGIVHRYPDRVLLKPVHICPVYCRFCFRREAVGPTGAGTLNESELQDALAYIENHPAIWEVIITGGDPLILSSQRLAAIAARLNEIPHVKTMRIHTRVPVADPARVTDDLIAALKSGPTIYVAIHANHPREFSPNARRACAALADAGIPLISQSVLLRGVNDQVEILGELMRTFVENRIKPYYLHHPDLAKGTSHFRLTVAEGQRLVEGLRGRYSGLCQPTYVLDIPGGYGKSPIGPGYFERNADGNSSVTDYQGTAHRYRS